MNTLVVTMAVLVDQTPSANQVVAGWGAFAIFAFGCVAVALLGWSLTRHLKKVERNAEAGVYDPSDPPRQRPLS